jgi:CBS domain containing-hemolysin-like protein
MNLWVRLTTPARWVIRMVADRVTTWIVGEARDADHILRLSEFRSLVADIEEEGLVSATDRVLIYNLLDAGGTEVEQIMIPRTRIHFARLHMTLPQVVDLLVKYKLSVVPVFEDTPDKIVGVVFAEEIVQLIRDGREVGEMTCKDVLRPALFVPLTKNTDQMLDFFQTQDEQAALVLDEFGGVAGMVTVEDVLHFIFGEIAGQFVDTESYVEEDENIFVVSGGMKLKDFEALTNFGIKDPRLTTIGGVVLRHLDRLPREEDEVSLEGVRLTVLEMRGNQIARLRAARLESLEEPEHASVPKKRGVA